MRIRPSKRRRSAAGQALVLMVGAMLAVVAMLGLIIDGGNAWANQRMVQSGNDAAAEAGAVIMAEKYAGATAPAIGWDAAIHNAVNASAAANNITVTAAYYTDICGIPLKSDGSAALNLDNTYNLAQADAVGTGLPTDTASPPDCPSRSVGPVAGVMVLAQHNIKTYFATLFGMRTFSVNTQATAAAGYLQEGCAASQGDACALLPLVFPVNITTCSKSGNTIDSGNPWVADAVTVYKVPLCKNDPGNVGWLDWTGKNGTSSIVNEITNPNNPAIPLPSWQNVAVPGNKSTAAIQTAIHQFDGTIVLIPQFDETCNGKNGNPDSSVPAINTSPNYGCPPPGINNGMGSNEWYRIPSFAHFLLCSPTDAACVTAAGPGNPVKGEYLADAASVDKAVCDTGNGATTCLMGKFVSIVSTGTIGAGFGGGTGSSKAVGVQLIK